MENRKNPFHELYVTESIGSDKFVQLFSPLIVPSAAALFQPGHIVLKGLPGSGKSMLLSLLKPAIRKSYHRANVPFPVSSEFSKFIGAGINLRRSGVSDFGQRPIGKDQSFEQSPFYFADYLNYYVVLDILTSIEELTDSKCDLSAEIGINNNPQVLDEFAAQFAQDGCWFGYLESIKNYGDLKSSLISRLNIYRSFLNYGLDSLPEEVISTKSLIGEPMLSCARLLKEVNVLSAETEVYVRIDQYEELAWLEDKPNNLGFSYQEMIHKLLGMRNNSVSYKLGTRHFAWKDGAKMYGTTARLEKLRNYDEISIDNILKRKENAKTWVFPDFAEDILHRRVEMASLDYPRDRKVIDTVFGTRSKPAEIARKYVTKFPNKAIKLEEIWPKPWKEFLNKLSQEDPLSARLGEAWSRQKGDRKKQVMTSIPKDSKDYPWNEANWWRKERTEQALMQIASRNRQNFLHWSGKQDVISLSGSNILVFLWLCRHVWAVWIRDSRFIEDTDRLDAIDPDIQSIGMLEASDAWYEKMIEVKGGRERQLFVHFVGSFFYKSLVNDEAMSYPGHNGFSIALDDLKANKDIESFLEEATAFGDLYDAPHTSKTSDKRKRKKWYLNPILSPHFKIPVVHTKEPMYIKADDIRKWLEASKGRNTIVTTKTNGDEGNDASGQLPLDF